MGGESDQMLTQRNNCQKHTGDTVGINYKTNC